MCLVVNKFATRAPDAVDCSSRSWQQAVAATDCESRRKRGFPVSNLRRVLSRFVADVGSSSGVEQTFSQGLAQFRHLRHFKGMWLRRALVLEGTRGQPEDADLALYSRARLIWEENFSEPRAPTKMKLYIPKSIKRALHANLHGHAEAAQRRRRERDLPKTRLRMAQTRTTSTPVEAASAALAARASWLGRTVCRGSGCWTRRTWALPRRQTRGTSKPTATKVRHAHTQPTVAVQCRKQHKLVITPGTLTWVGDDDSTVPLQRALRMRQALRETYFSRARVFVVLDVASPPRLLGLAAPLVGGLVVSTAYFVNPPGPALRYNRALRLLRWVGISERVCAAWPLATQLIKQVVATGKLDLRGTRWQLIKREEGVFSQSRPGQHY